MEPKVEENTRHVVLEFLQDLVQGQYLTLDLMRAEIFRFNKTIIKES